MRAGRAKTEQEERSGNLLETESVVTAVNAEFSAKRSRDSSSELKPMISVGDLAHGYVVQTGSSRYRLAEDKIRSIS
jgi:hypothetical protein